jgi:SPP1 family predicted phage head-tail adaptor
MADCKCVRGKFKRRLTIQTVARVSDGQGGYTETWNDGDKVWGSIEPVKSFEKYQAMQLQVPVSHNITIRYCAGLTTAQRFKYEDRIFEIKSIINPNEANLFHEIKALEMTT